MSIHLTPTQERVRLHIRVQERRGATIDEISTALGASHASVSEYCPLLVKVGLVVARRESRVGKAHHRKRYFDPAFAPPEQPFLPGPARPKPRRTTAEHLGADEPLVYSSKFTGVVLCDPFVPVSFASEHVSAPVFSAMRFGQYEHTGSAIERALGQAT